MKFVVVGLGNPGDEYHNSRHNIGWHVVGAFAHTYADEGFSHDKKSKSEVAKGAVGSHEVTLVLPHTFMNKSGAAVKEFVKSTKAAERLVVVYDDIDLPLGTLRIAFGRGSGGHKGIESIVRGIKTKDFVRVRVGVAPTTPSGKVKKPKGEQAVIDFVLGTFTKKQQDIVTDITGKAVDAIYSVIIDGRAAAMNKFN